MMEDVLPGVCAKASKQEMEYLSYLQRTRFPNLQFGYNSRTQRAFHVNGRKFLVDGFDPDTKTVVEFLGCFHGCPTCVEMHEFNRYFNDTLMYFNNY